MFQSDFSHFNWCYFYTQIQWSALPQENVLVFVTLLQPQSICVTLNNVSSSCLLLQSLWLAAAPQPLGFLLNTVLCKTKTIPGTDHLQQMACDRIQKVHPPLAGCIHTEHVMSVKKAPNSSLWMLMFIKVRCATLRMFLVPLMYVEKGVCRHFLLVSCV